MICPDSGEDVPRALKAAYRELKQEGVTGLVVSKFHNCVAAFILKDKTKELKINGVAKALESGRQTNQAVVKQLLCFVSANDTYGDMKVQKMQEEEMPDFEEAVERLANVNAAAFRAMHANALKAKRYGRMTPLEDAILTHTQDVKEWLACKEEAESMLFSADAPGPDSLDNFKGI